MKMNTKTKRILASVVRSIAPIMIAQPLMKCGRRLNWNDPICVMTENKRENKT